MKTISTLVLTLFICYGFAQSQSGECISASKNTEQLSKNPASFVNTEALEAYTKDYIAHHQNNNGARTGPYVIPVVFHIIHDGGSEMIPDSLVRVEVSHMNEYMSASNPGLSSIVPAFDTLIGNAQIEFRLAQKDPQGVCTNGIDRIYSWAAHVGNEYTKINPWPNDKYLNIWLTRGIDYDDTNFGTIGYAFNPGVVASTPNIDGILAKSFITGANDAYNRPTMTHCAGHWLNLLHPVSSSCADTVNDMVADTPPMTYASACNLTQSICNPPVIENVQNIMVGNQCSLMFTKGQVNRMWAALNSPIAGRNNVWSAANLQATGTDVANPVSCAVPVADFTASVRYVCLGQPVTFKDASYNASVTSRQWTFPGDAVATSTTSDTTSVSFNTSGWKQVTFQVNNANGSNQKTKTMIYAFGYSQISAPFFEGFEDQSTAQSLWQSINYDNNSTSFQYSQNGGHHSNSSYKLNDFDAKYAGDVDELLSPAFDITGFDSTQATLSFDYSFATADVNHTNDSVTTLQVFATKNCESTWTRLYTQAGPSLFNGGVQASSYSPGQGDEYWQSVIVNIPAAYRTADVNFRIRITNGTGINNFYIDNINVGQSTNGISDLKTSLGSLDIVPNPTKDNPTIVIYNLANDQAHIDLYDMQGREMGQTLSPNLKSGTNRIPLNTGNLSSGIYIVKLSDGSQSIQKRFVKL